MEYWWCVGSLLSASLLILSPVYAQVDLSLPNRANWDRVMWKFTHWRYPIRRIRSKPPLNLKWGKWVRQGMVMMTAGDDWSSHVLD